MCGGSSGTLWLLSHHPGGCCTLVVDEETPPSQCSALWVLRKALYKCNELLLLLCILKNPFKFQYVQFVISGRNQDSALVTRKPDRFGFSMLQLVHYMKSQWNMSQHWRHRWPKNKNSVIIYSPSSSSKPVWISVNYYTVEPSLTHYPTLKPTHTTKPGPNLPVSHLNCSKSVLQYNINTISTLYSFYDVST